jgi:hyperpolarization activated cyclic nucleotide-gated potassium channel 2
MKFDLIDEPWTVRYINSIYWAVTTMITVGYGDISPQTPIERLFGIFFL